MFYSLLKWARSRRAASTIRRRSLFRPALEILEDRQAPAALTVNSLADNTAADTVLTLREAILAVDGTLGRSLTTAEKTLVAGTLGTNDRIQFSLPTGRQTITLTGGALSITRAVTVAGPGSDLLSISGNNASRVFVIGNIYSQNLSLVAAISGLTVANGSALTGNSNYGAGILDFGTLTVSNCIFSGNAAGNSGGAGIYNDGALSVSNCAFASNSVTNVGAGAGILNTSSATLTVTNCTFTGNVGTNGSSGGGISNSGTATVTDCTFSGNSVASNGAGIHNSSSGKLTLSNCSFVNGTCTSDGGGFDSDGTATVSNCTFSGNSVGSEGGAIDSHGTLTISNCTLAGNTAVSRGGGINISGQSQITNCTINGNRVSSSSGSGGGIYDSVAAKLCNTIVTGNFVGQGTTASDIVGTVATISAFNLIGTGGSGGLANRVNGNQVGVTNSGLGALANNGGSTQTIALMPASPAIDRGSNTFVATGATDQRGLARIVNGTVDIGAFEVQSSGTQTASSFLIVGFPSPATAGAAGTITVTAKDAAGNTVPSFTGTVHFTSSDPQAVLPADYTFVAGDNGNRSFDVTLKTAGTQSVAAAATGAPSITGTQAPITVTPAPARTFTVAGFPSPIAVGGAGSFAVTAQDAFGNTATGYSGTVHFTSSDGQATLPADSTLTAGAGSFAAAFATSGSQSLIATDTVTQSINGTQAGITVNPVGAAPGLTVNSSADNTAADNLLTLREAIAVVDGALGRALTPGEQAQIVGPIGPSSTIQFSLPPGPQTITLTGGALNITQPVTINGPGAANLIVSGNNQDRVFIVGHDYSQNLNLHVSITGLTIAGGSAVVAGRNYGGGLLNFGTLVLTNIIFSGNIAGTSGGGSIYNDGALTVSNSTFTANSVNNGGPGGAIQNATPATLTVTGCTFSANTATAGASGAAIANSGIATVAGSTITGNSADSNAGGIYNSSEGHLTVTACTIANNTCGSDGAGIDNDGTATVSTSTLSGNSAGSEGGGMDSKGPLTLTNCTLYGNTAVSDGGGLTTSASALITNCTITANRVTAGTGGGGIRDQGTAARIFNTIIAGNFRGPASSTTPDDIAGSVDLASAFNLIGTGGSGGLTNGVNNNQVGIINAGLGTLANNGGPTLTVALLTGSLAIDRGSNARVSAGETDQRGLARIVGGTVDIGAFEVQ